MGAMLHHNATFVVVLRKLEFDVVLVETTNDVLHNLSGLRWWLIVIMLIIFLTPRVRDKFDLDIDLFVRLNRAEFCDLRQRCC